MRAMLTDFLGVWVVKLAFGMKESTRTKNLVDRDSFKLSFRTIDQAGFQLKESGMRTENKLKISST